MKSLVFSLALTAMAIVAPIMGEPAPAVKTPIEHITPIEAPTQPEVDGVFALDVMAAFNDTI